MAFLFADVFNKFESSEKGGVFLWSDIHAEHKKNRKILKLLVKDNNYKDNDVLLLAGDVCWNIEQFELTIRTFKKIFKTVIFVPGNSELRVDYNEEDRVFKDSIEKFEAVMKVCQENDIVTTPTRIRENVVVIPILGFYVSKFDDSYTGDDSFHRRWLDFRTIFFPNEIKSDPNEFFRDIVEKNMEDFEILPSDKVISLSHFLPRRELLPSLKWLPKKSLPFIMGNKEMDKLVRKYKPKGKPSIHCFGHSHINFDKKIKDVHYIQHSLAHPSERKAVWKYFQKNKPKLVYNFK